MNFSNSQLERYSRQMVLKKIGVIGQKKLLNSKVLIVGAGGLGSPLSIYLAGLGVGEIGIVDFDKIEISNLHRQILFNIEDLKKNKSKIALKKLKKINPNIKITSFNSRLNKKNINKIAEKFDLIADGSDNFKTRFLINDYCLKRKKILVSGAISKFDGHIYTFNFLKKNSPCLRCLMPKIPKNITLNCEFDGVLGPLAGMVGCIQASEIVKEILHIGDSLCGSILIIDSLKLTFRKVKLKKNAKCMCSKKY
tara:strand:+ start:196 stop:951 length:756 start_codon:yes stop_codon:yes gene_type:complete